MPNSAASCSFETSRDGRQQPKPARCGIKLLLLRIKNTRRFYSRYRNEKVEIGVGHFYSEGLFEVLYQIEKKSERIDHASLQKAIRCHLTGIGSLASAATALRTVSGVLTATLYQSFLIPLLDTRNPTAVTASKQLNPNSATAGE